MTQEQFDTFDDMDHYEVIGDTNELKWFFEHILPKPKFSEGYAFTLASRNKYLTKEEQPIHKGRSEMLEPQVVFPNSEGVLTYERWSSGVFRYNVDKRAYLDGDGNPFKMKSLVVYTSPNPTDEVKAAEILNQYISQHAFEAFNSARSGNKSGIKNSEYKLSRTLTKMKRLQFENAPKKHWLDFDIDLEVKNYCVVYDTFLSFFKKGEFAVIETRSGYHVLLKKDALKINPHLITYDLSTKLQTKEAKLNDNSIIPLPGSFQSGFIVNVVNKGDFE